MTSTPRSRAAGLPALTLHGDQIAALTCFYDTSVRPHCRARGAGSRKITRNLTPDLATFTWTGH